MYKNANLYIYFLKIPTLIKIRSDRLSWAGWNALATHPNNFNGRFDISLGHFKLFLHRFFQVWIVRLIVVVGLSVFLATPNFISH